MDQFELFLFSKMQNYFLAKAKEENSQRCQFTEDFVVYHETSVSESKPWASQQNHGTRQVWEWPCAFSIAPAKKIKLFLHFHKLVSAFKKSWYFIHICSGGKYKVNSNILQFDGMRSFQPISLKLDFSNTWDVYKNITNKKKIHYRPRPEKVNDHNFQ